GLGQLLGTVVLDAAVHPGNREFGQEADLGYHHLVVRVLGGNVVDLGFEGQQHITDAALDEGGGGTATAGVEYSHVAEEGTQVVVDGSLILAKGLLSVGQGCQVAVTAITRGLGVGQYRAHVITCQVVPVLDVFRVTLAHQECHG